MADMTKEKRQSRTRLRKKFAAFEAAVEREIDRIWEQRGIDRRYRSSSPPRIYIESESSISKPLKFCTDAQSRQVNQAIAKLKAINATVKKRYSATLRALESTERAAKAVVDIARKKLEADEFSLDVTVTTPDETAALRNNASVNYNYLIKRLGKLGLDTKAIGEAMPAI